MKYFLVVAGILMLTACNKNDVIAIKNLFKSGCYVTSINSDKQNTNDFFMTKTFDRAGKLVHLKTQLKDIVEGTFIYDYDISYGYNKAILHGKTTSTFWALDDPEDQSSDPAVHLESSQVTDTKSFEILLDPKTKYPKEIRYIGTTKPLLRVIYDRRYFIDSIKVYEYDQRHRLSFTTNFNVNTDNHGNILSIHEDTDPEVIRQFGYLGVEYGYSSGAVGKHQFYETPNIFIHPWYNILELLDWGPFQPSKERISGEVVWAYPPDEINLDVGIGFNYINHVYDAKGNLVSYTFDGEFGRMFAPGQSHMGQRNRTLTWNCKKD